MGSVIQPPVIMITPRDGQLEIKLNINITLDGTTSVISEDIKVKAQAVEEKEKTKFIIPEFGSGTKIDFGK